LKEKKIDGERISLINSPIDGMKQSVFQKKLNIIKYWEVVDAKIKKENAPLFRNHKPLKIPDPREGFKFIPHKEVLSPRTVTTNLRTTYHISMKNDKFWIKRYENISKIFTLYENFNITRREFIKYCWNRKDRNITAKWNSVVIEDEWKKHVLQVQDNPPKIEKFCYTLDFYINICKLGIFENNEVTLIELKLQEYIEDIELTKEQAEKLYI
jgi:hypothetical protein